MLSVSCQDLNIDACDFVEQADTADEALKKMVSHLRKAHGFDIRLEGVRFPDAVEGDVERMLVYRLRDHVLGQVSAQYRPGS